MRVLTFVLALILASPLAVPLHATPSKLGAAIDKTNIVFPRHQNVVDVTKAPYNAKGDGISDDTQALQKALSDVMGRHKILYFPNGTYLISSTLKWSKRNADGGEAWGFNWIQGQSQDKTIIRLKDTTFIDAAKPQSLMWCGGFGSADWFHNYIQNLTLHVGKNNPGSIGLQFYSNNTGALRNVSIISQDGQGITGLDLAHADMNGPLLVSNVVVRGFDVGIRTGASVNSQTFEQISLSGQKKTGLINAGQHISIRSLVSENSVPAVENQSGLMALLDARLTGKTATSKSAILRGKTSGAMMLRDVVTQGHSSALANTDGVIQRGPNILEYFSNTPSTLFPSAKNSLRLPVKETPNIPWDNLNQWAVVDDFGADPTGNRDSSDAIQKAMDSGATTVFFPGCYQVSKTIEIRGKVRRVLGAGNWINYGRSANPDLRISDGTSPVVCIEHFAPIGGGIEVATNRTVLLRSLEAPLKFSGKGDIFLEDIASGDVRFNGQNVWARQLNVENEGTHIAIQGGALWLLGYKTERGGTLLHASSGAKAEVLGNFSYTTTAGKLAPMFVNENSSVFAFFGEVCYSGDPFQTWVRETRGEQTKELKTGEGWSQPYIGFPVATSTQTR